MGLKELKCIMEKRGEVLEIRDWEDTSLLYLCGRGDVAGTKKHYVEAVWIGMI